MMNWKGYGRKKTWPNYGQNLRIFVDGLNKTIRNSG